MKRSIRAAFLALLLVPAFALAADLTWPQWRGPTRDGIVGGPAWPGKLGEANLTRTWEVADLGPSYSGPIVTEDRVFVTETVGKKDEFVRCLDRKTGKQLWKVDWAGAMTAPFFAARNGSWIRSTPAWDGEALYVGGIRDLLVCLEGKDGKERWRIDFMKELESPLPAFGCVCSPLVDGQFVYMQAGSSMVKLDKKTGKIVWKTLKNADAAMGSAFSSPILAKIAGTEMLLVQTRDELVGLDKVDGAILWKKAIPTFRGMNILTPAPFGDGVFTSTYGGNTRFVSLKSEGGKYTPEDGWTLKYEGYMTSPVVIDGYAYLYGKDRRYICVDLKTGKEMWRSEKRFGEYTNLVAQKDKILALDERGSLFLIAATPKEFKVLDERKVAGTETWALLAVCGDELFVRELAGVTAWKWK